MEYLCDNGSDNQEKTTCTALEVCEVNRKQPPSCFRQVGHPNDDEHIFVEDYVSSYLMHLGEESVESGCLLAVFGETNCVDGCRQWYLNGAAKAELAEKYLTPDGGEAVNEEIRRLQREHFPDLQFLGWMLQLPAFLLGGELEYEKLGKCWFGERELCMVTYNVYEQNLDFCIRARRRKPINGYYVFYERNFPMQEYMVDHHWECKEPNVGDRTAEAIRTRFREEGNVSVSEQVAQCLKKGRESLQTGVEKIAQPIKKCSMLSAITFVTGFVFVVLLIIFVYSQYHNMDQVAEAVRLFTKQILAKK